MASRSPSPWVDIAASLVDGDDDDDDGCDSFDEVDVVDDGVGNDDAKGGGGGDATATATTTTETTETTTPSSRRRGHRRRPRPDSSSAPTHSSSPSPFSGAGVASITPLHHVPYVHGGYAAAAPLFVNDARFAFVLRRLLPAAYDELGVLLRNGGGGGGRTTTTTTTTGGGAGGAIDKKEGGGGDYDDGATSAPTSTASYSLLRSNDGIVPPDPVKVMKWAENNPVVSAFGIWNSDSGRRTIDLDRRIRRLRRMRRRRRRRGGDGEDRDDDHADAYDDDNDDDDDDDDDDDSGATDDDRRAGSVITIGSGNFGRRNVRRDDDRHRARDTPDRVRRALPSTTTTSRRRVADSIVPVPGGASERPRFAKPALEWDLFLDPDLVRSVDKAMGIADDLDLRLRKARIRRERRRRAAAAAGTNCRERRDDDDGGGGGGGGDDNDDIGDDFDLSQSHTAAQVEVDRLVSQLIRRTIIAHGSMSQLVLEAMGVAQKYNYRTVVKSSRDGTIGGDGGGGVALGPTTPSKFSPSRSGTSSWDEEEERRDFEALLGPSTLDGGGGRSGVVNSGKRRGNFARSAGGSKGMFMERWLHVFARALSLLDKSSDCGSGDGVAAVPKASSSSSGDGRETRIVCENRPADIGQRGLSGLLEKIFLRRDSSYSHPGKCTPATPVAGVDVVDEDRVSTKDVNDVSDFHNDDSELLTNDDMFSPASSPTASAFGGFCGVSLCFGGEGGGAYTKRGSAYTFPANPHASHKMVQDVERISAVLGEPLRLVKKGDIAYFNGGSLMWKRSSIMEAAERGCCGPSGTDPNATFTIANHRSPRAAGGGGAYSFQPYAYPRSALSDWERVMCKSTIEDYRRHFNLKIGVYVQEFSISPEALDALSIFVNKHGDLYDQGLAFGGVNGAAVKNIHGDGYWNQRYMGRSWDFDARPSKEMTPLKPEDHHLVQKAIQAGAWGQVGTIYEVTNEMAGALTVTPPREPCNVVNDWA
ncbi:hypothetical protein ACHAW5_009833 [Stephanodiscus triporus]|uniref:Uncharacterized protein n=1 Tax=Stephanodiscus triporus TaxID=2934178 RepID=A0ABD3NCE9_9STRA